MKLVLTSLTIFILDKTRAQTPGWYHSDIGQSCNQKCADVGIPFQTERTNLVCTQTNFEVVLNNLRNAGTFGGCSGYRDEVNQGTVPMKDSTNGECVFRSQGTQNGNQADADMRICCCSNSGTESLLDCPLQEISSCSQCALAGLLGGTWAEVCQNSVCQTGQSFVNGECVCDDPLATFNVTTSLCHYPAKNFTINCDDPGEIIDETFPPDQGEKIKEHGCHCTKLSVLSIVENYVGGAGKVDNIDNQCKDWFEARRCTQLNSCRGFNLKDYDYTLVIEGQSHVAYCEQIFQLGYTPEEEQCLYDICVIDSTYAMGILYSLEDIYVDWDSIVVTEDMCPHCEQLPCRTRRECTGQPPFYGNPPF